MRKYMIYTALTLVLLFFSAALKPGGKIVLHKKEPPATYSVRQLDTLAKRVILLNHLKQNHEQK